MKNPPGLAGFKACLKGNCSNPFQSSVPGRNKMNYTTLVDAIAAAGLGTPDIIHDGAIHRFTSPDDRPRSNNCWFVSHGTAGAFGSWKLGFTTTWSDGKSENNTALLEGIREYQRHRDADMEILRNDAADDAVVMWMSASTAINHPYPLIKRIIPYGARQADSALLIPMYFKGRLVNIQRTYSDGKKRFMKSARVTGAYYPIGNILDSTYICEGYATGCSLHEHTGAPVAVAFNCGNLKAVAISIRKRYPTIKITLAADNDVATPGNPGLTKGRAAAAGVGGDFIYPDFSDEVFDGTDYNDYLSQGGQL
jgi:putative DNA primase/helicase